MFDYFYIINYYYFECQFISLQIFLILFLLYKCESSLLFLTKSTKLFVIKLSSDEAKKTEYHNIVYTENIWRL